MSEINSSNAVFGILLGTFTVWFIASRIKDYPRDNSNTSDNGGYPTSNHLPISTKFDCQNHVANGSDEPNQENSGPNNRWTRIEIITAIYTVVTTFILAGTVWQASLTRQAIKPATDAAQATQGQLDVARNGQRPWLGTGYVGYPPDQPFQLQFKNGGQSPALDVAITARAIPGTFSQPPQMPSHKCNVDCKMEGAVLLPDVPFQWVLLREKIGDSPTTFNDRSAWVIGRADYKDATGKPHVTIVCYFHDPALHDITTCPMPGSNYAD